MNIEIKKMLGRTGVYAGFYALVILIGFLLILSKSGGFGSGTGSGTGSGSGSGGTGGGSGRGAAEKGWGPGAGKDGLDGTGKTVISGKDQAGSGGEEEKAKPVEKSPRPSASKGTDSPRAVPQKKLITVAGKGELSEDMPVIHVPGKPAPAPKGGAKKAVAGFFGIKVGGSDRILFLLDVSGSMQSTTRDGGMSRIDLLKREMAKCLKEGYRDATYGNGKSDGIFRIVTFHNQCRFYPNSVSSCRFSRKSDVDNGISFVNSMNAGGGTAMLMAWSTILPVIRENRIKTVCFLSDGAPNDCSAEQLLDVLRKAVPELVIHGIAMGLESDLLKRVSRQHAGTYREVY